MQFSRNSRRACCALPMALVSKVLCVAVVIASLGLISGRSLAANPTWNNTGTDFNADASWDAGASGAAPDSTEIAIFSGPAGVNQPNLSTSLTVLGLDFTTTDAAGYTLSATGGSVLSLASTSATIGGAAISGRNTAGTNTITTGIALLNTGSATQVFDQAIGGTLVLNGAITGGNANTTLAFRNGGTFTLGVANSYTGTTSLGGGAGPILGQIVNVGDNAAFGTSNITFGTGGTTLVAFGGARTLTNNITLASSNSSTIGGSNDFTFSGNLSQDSSNRTLNVNNIAKTLFSGTVFLSNSATTGRTMTFASSGAIEISGPIVDSSLAGTAQSILGYSGSGSLTLSGTSNTYSGGTNLSGAGAVIFKNTTVFSSGPINFTGNGTLDNGTGAATTLGNAINLSGGSMTFVGTNDLILSNVVTMTAANRSITVTNAGATLTLSGGLTDSGTVRAFTKSGLGTVVLNAASTYTGGTTVGAGTLRLNHVNALGGGTVVMSGGATLSLGSGLTISAGNAVNVSSAATFNGVAGSSIAFGFLTSLANSSQIYTVDNIGLSFTGADLASSTVTINATRSMTLNGSGTITFTGAVTATHPMSLNSALTYAGTGTLNVQGNNTNGGALIATSGTINQSGTLAGGATVQGGIMNSSGNIAGAVSVTSGTMNLSATASSTAAISSTGTLNVTGAGALGGTTTLTGGTLGIGNNNAITGTLSLTTAAGVVQSTDATAHTVGGTLTIGAAANFGGTGNLTFTYAGNLATTGTSTITATNFTQLNGVFGGTAALVKIGTGTLALAGTNVNSGGTTVGVVNTANAGTLQLAGTGTIANAALNVIAGTFDLNGINQSITTLSMGTGSATSNAAITLGGGTLSLGGDVTFSATNNALGAAISGAGAVSLNANRNFVIGDSSNAPLDLTVSSTIQNGAATSQLTKTGAGTLRLTGTNTYSGGTIVSAGAISVDAINGNGGIGTGNISLGTTTVAGTLIYTGGAGETTARVITLAGTTGGGVIDQSGGGLLNFTSDILNPGVGGGSSAKTLTLQGAGNGEISGKIVDATAGTTLTTGIIKLGTGTWTLSGANTYTGTTIVGATAAGNSGTLNLGAATYTGTTSVFWGTVNYAAGAAITIGAGGYSLGGGVTGSTATVTLGAGTTLSLGGTINYTGTTSNGAIISGGSIAFAANRTAAVSDSSNATADLTINTPMSGAFSLTKTGAGNLSLGSANGFTGGLFVGTNNSATTNAGAGTVTLTANGAGGTGLAKVLAGTLDIGNTTQTFTVAGTAVDLGGGATSSTATILIGTSGVLNLGGNLVRSVGGGANSDTSTISGGTLNLNGTRTFTINDSTATATDMVISSNIADGSAVSGINKNTNVGTLVMTGTNGYSGTTTINAGAIIVGVNGVGSASNSAFSVAAGGTLGGSGTVKSITSTAGTVSPGSLTGSNGILTSTGNVSITTATGHFAVDVSKAVVGAGPIVGSDYDQLATTTGTVTLTNADLILVNNPLGYMEAGDVFFIINNGSGTGVTGTFATLNGSATTLTDQAIFTMANGLQFQISYDANYNPSGVSTFDSGGNDVALKGISVPEPASMSLLAIGALGLLRRRRRAA